MPIDEKEIEDVLQILESFMEKGESRLKIRTDEASGTGEVKKQYHLGRCDVGSPWACGEPFDVLDMPKPEDVLELDV